jgi:hypothetical protein
MTAYSLQSRCPPPRYIATGAKIFLFQSDIHPAHYPMVSRSPSQGQRDQCVKPVTPILISVSSCLCPGFPKWCFPFRFTYLNYVFNSHLCFTCLEILHCSHKRTNQQLNQPSPSNFTRISEVYTQSCCMRCCTVW